MSFGTHRNLSVAQMCRVWQIAQLQDLGFYNGYARATVKSISRKSKHALYVDIYSGADSRLQNWSFGLPFYTEDWEA